MIRIEFTEEAVDKLRYERFHHPHPRLQRKMEALLLKSEAEKRGRSSFSGSLSTRHSLQKRAVVIGARPWIVNSRNWSPLDMRSW